MMEIRSYEQIGRDLREALVVSWLGGFLLGIVVGLCLMVFLPSRSEGSEPPVCDVRVDRVVDGDTFFSHGLTVLSPTVFFPEPFGYRLIDVYAPERGENGYFLAKSDLAEMILGKFVSVKLPDGKRVRDKYGRLLVYVTVCGWPDKGFSTDVNALMRRKGWVDSGRGVPK